VGTVPRNVYFILTVIISALCAYFFNPVLLDMLEDIFSKALPRSILKSDLVHLSGFASLMGLALLVFTFILPALRVWYYLAGALRAIAELPLAHEKLHQTTVKSFLAKLSDLGFIHDLARIYSSHLVQGPDQEISSEVLEEMKVSKILLKNNKNKKFIIAPVRAVQTADFVFNPHQLVDQRIFMWFFNMLPTILAGIGGICLMLSFVDFALNSSVGGGTPMLVGLQAGVVSIALCLISAIIVTIISRLMGDMLRGGAHRLCHDIDNLFHHDSLNELLSHMTDNVDSAAISDDMALKLERTIAKPLNAMTRATKALAAEQEEKLDTILGKTLARFTLDYEKNAGLEADSLNQSLKASAKAAKDMEKHIQDSSVKFSKQLDQQASAIARHLSDMQKILEKAEKKSKDSLSSDVEKMVKNLTEEMQDNFEKFGKYMDQSLTELSIRQDKLDHAVVNKDNILQDLHKTARDLGTISEASGQLLEKFSRLSKGMENILEQTGPMQGQTSSMASGMDREKMIDALKDLQKITKNKSRELPKL